MRGGPPATPVAISSAAPTPCVGTKPSWRAAAASRQAATSTAPRSAELRQAAVPVGEREQRMAAVPAAVGVERPRVGARRPARPPRSPAGPAPPASPRRTRGTAAASGARSADGSGGRGSRSAVRDGKLVAPHPQREAEPEVRREQRVRPLAREVRRRARDAEADRVERPVERRRAELDRAQQRLGVRDRRRPRERGRGAERRGQRADHAASAPGPAARGTARVNGERTIRSSEAGS